MKIIKYFFYKFINYLSDHSPEPNTTGVGIYDKKAIEILKNINDPNPYLRGMVFELGFKINFLDFEQQARKSGKSKNKPPIQQSVHSIIPLLLYPILPLSPKL